MRPLASTTSLVTGIVIGLAVSGGTHPAARGRELFVNNLVGDERFDGRTPVHRSGYTGPVRTITKALRLARPGDRVVLAKTEVPYRESVTLVGPRHSGDGLRPFILDGQGATLDGTTPIPAELWENVRDDLFRYRPRRLGHQVLYLDGRPAVERAATWNDAALPALEVHEWCLWRGWLYFRIDGRRLLDDYALSAPGAEVGITLYQTRGVVVQDLIIQGFRLDGVAAHDDVRYATLAGLTCRGNGRAGLSAGGSTQLDLVASLVGDNGRVQVLAQERAWVAVLNSTLLDRSGPATHTDGGRVTIDGVEPPASSPAGPVD